MNRYVYRQQISKALAVLDNAEKKSDEANEMDERQFNKAIGLLDFAIETIGKARQAAKDGDKGLSDRFLEEAISVLERFGEVMGVDPEGLRDV